MHSQSLPLILKRDISTTPFELLTKASVIPMYKPLRWSSFFMVKKVRFITKSKVGHAGTLDPLAAGLMLLGIGKGTKQLTKLIKLDKDYQAEVTLGAVTASYDLEKPPENAKPFSHLQSSEITNVINTFQGDIEQIPPIFSAIKQSGKRMYELARKGIPVNPAARLVHIHHIEVVAIDLPKVLINISCSSGTYIRSLAHDIGQKLGCGAYLSNLKRTKIGSISLADALTYEEIAAWQEQHQKG